MSAGCLAGREFTHKLSCLVCNEEPLCAQLLEQDLEQQHTEARQQNGLFGLHHVLWFFCISD